MSSVYAGASFETVVSNTTTVSADFDFTSQGFLIAPTIAISVNGGTFRRVNLSETVVLATGLSKSQSHTIKVVYDGFDQYDSVWSTPHKTITLRGVRVDEGGTYRPTGNKKKNILFVGDSITAGVRSLSDNDSIINGSAVASYPFEVAKNLNINDYRSAFGGAGVIKPGSNGGKVQDFVRYDAQGFIANDNIHTVVMVVGTNDNPFSEDPATFKQNYQTLINRVRQSHPRQRIFMVDIPTGNGSWGAQLSQLAKENQNCTYVSTSGWSSQISTTDGLHPDANGAVTLGRLISEALIAYDWEGTGGVTPEPEPEPEPTPATNLWTAPKSFNPLERGWGAQTGAMILFPGTYAGKTFRLTFKAKSDKGLTLKVFTEFQRDFSREIVLTGTLTDFTFDWEVSYDGEGNLLTFVSHSSMNDETIISDIVVSDIFLEEL